jgi:hypothetical protein
VVDIVAGEGWSAQNNEIVVVLSDQHDASFALTINIPDVVVGVNFNPLLVNLEPQFGEFADIIAIDESYSIFRVVLLFL